MWQCWMAFILAVVSMATPAVCQSGDDGGLGSGFDMYTPVMSQAAADQPVKNPEWTTPPPELTSDPQPDSCSVHFTTRAASARRLKAEKEELAYLHAIQDGNKAVMENLEQYVGAELGNQSYEDVIKDNIVGIQEEHRSCRQVVEKAEEDLEKQLEGNVLDSSAGRQRMREEALALEDMLRAAAAVASRLERSSQALHASFSKQLRAVSEIHR